MDILTRLLVKSILRFRSVCKSWYNLFRNPDFIKMHLYHSNRMNYFSLILTKYDDDGFATFLSVDYNHSLSLFDQRVKFCCPLKYRQCLVEILGSCNGLICLKSKPKVVCIWNPCTNEYVKLPRVSGIPSIRSYGFGYDCKTCDYKVVRIVTGDWDSFSRVIVHTLGTDSWRILQDIPYSICISRVNGVHLNGVLHWMLGTRSRVNEAANRVIVSFDIGDENFKEMQLPFPLCEKRGRVDISDFALCLLGGNLCLLGNPLNSASVDVWILKEYGVMDSWTKVFSISTLNTGINLRPIQSFQNGEILLCKVWGIFSNKHNEDLVLYNPISRRTKFMDTRAYQKLDNVHTYVGSLVSVKSVCNVVQEETLDAIV